MKTITLLEAILQTSMKPESARIRAIELCAANGEDPDAEATPITVTPEQSEVIVEFSAPISELCNTQV